MPELLRVELETYDGSYTITLFDKVARSVPMNLIARDDYLLQLYAYEAPGEALQLAAFCPGK